MTEPAKLYLTAPVLEAIPWLVHGFGTSRLREDDFARIGLLAPFRPVIMRQLHSDIVYRVDAPSPARLSGDALITNAPGLLLVVRTADCLPVLLADGKNRAVASVHCGWRGTRARILERAVREMGSAYDTEPSGLLAAFGPCIGTSCYEVGPEVGEAFASAGFPEAVLSPAPGRPGKFLLDLRTANIWLLEGLGVKRSAVWSAEACTHCDRDLFSYRRNRGESRRLYNFIGIRAAARSVAISG
jgi:YfiH family protein